MSGLCRGRRGTGVVHNPAGPLAPLDDLPDLPYDRVDMSRYSSRTTSAAGPWRTTPRSAVRSRAASARWWRCRTGGGWRSRRRGWSGRSRRLARLSASTRCRCTTWTSSSPRRGRGVRRAHRPLGIAWWALGRVDMLMHYSDATWRKMARSGLKMVFSGAEVGSDATLAAMNKGGKASSTSHARARAADAQYGVVPSSRSCWARRPIRCSDVDGTFDFIRRLKQINPRTEIVLYTYTPVPMDGQLYDGARRLGFAFPQTLEEWASPTSGNSSRCGAATAFPGWIRRGPPPRPRLRARGQRLLSDRDRSPPDRLPPRGAQGGERVALWSPVVRRALRAARCSG